MIIRRKKEQVKTIMNSTMPEQDTSKDVEYEDTGIENDED